MAEPNEDEIISNPVDYEEDYDEYDDDWDYEEEYDYDDEC